MCFKTPSAPGTALEPTTVVQLSVQEIWRGESRIAGQDRLFHELASFDAMLLDGGKICYVQGLPLPPQIRNRALVVLGPRDELELREDPEAYLEWVRQATGEAERR